MAFVLPICVVACFLISCGADHIGWNTNQVKHRFYDTPYGQLHYVIGGSSDEPETTLVLLHGHPRSTVEWKYLVADSNLGGVQFLAVDFFGMGLSDDYTNNEAPFCTFDDFASHILGLLQSENINKFVPVGHLKGAHVAIALAAAAGQHRVSKLVVMNPLILSPAAKTFIDEKLIPMLQNATLKIDGSHLVAAWSNLDAAPMGLDGELSAKYIVPNQEKTMDALQSFSTNWKMDAAWTSFNEKNVPLLAQLDAYAESMLVFGMDFLALDEKWNLDPQFSLSAFAEALTHGHNTTYFLDGAGQGMLAQNASLIASLVQKFVAA